MRRSISGECMRGSGIELLVGVLHVACLGCCKFHGCLLLCHLVHDLRELVQFMDQIMLLFADFRHRTGGTGRTIGQVLSGAACRRAAAGQVWSGAAASGGDTRLTRQGLQL